MKNTNWRDVPIPALMKHLPVDRRGFPIPPIVLVDDNGAKFAVNDEFAKQKVMAEDCCGICGKPLYRARWLVGGPGSAFLPHGAYLDPPMHTECMHYAMQVCPYLAAPNWKNGVSVGAVQAKNVTLDGETKAIPVFGSGFDKVFPNRPDVFVCVQYTGKLRFSTNEDMMPVFRPPTPFRQIEYWSEGRRLSQAEGAALVVPILDDMVQTLEEKRIAP